MEQPIPLAAAGYDPKKTYFCTSACQGKLAVYGADTQDDIDYLKKNFGRILKDITQCSTTDCNKARTCS